MKPNPVSKLPNKETSHCAFTKLLQSEFLYSVISQIAERITRSLTFTFFANHVLEFPGEADLHTFSCLYCKP